MSHNQPAKVNRSSSVSPAIASSSSLFTSRPFEPESETIEAEASPPRSVAAPSGNPTLQAQTNRPFQSGFSFLNVPLYAPQAPPPATNAVQAKESEEPGEEELEETTVQTKLAIGKPGDQYEQEADRMATQVMRMPEPQPANEEIAAQSDDSLIQRKCAKCEAELDSTEASVQRKETTGKSSPTADLQNRLGSQNGKGSPLPDGVRSFMEPRFGSDFSQVRVHTDASAAQMNKDLGAQAFTHGSDVYFNAGKYNPGSSGGQELIAHELTHTIQQTGGVHNKVQKKCPACGKEETHLQPKLEVNAERQVESVGAANLESVGELTSENGAEATDAPEVDGTQSTEALPGSEDKSRPDEAAEDGGEGESAATTDTSTSTSSPSNSNANADVSAASLTDRSTSEPSIEGTEAPVDGVSPEADEPVAPESQGDVTAPNDGEASAASDCTPECYKGPREEPAVEPEETPSDPPPAQVEAEASEGEEEDLPEIDDCPTEQTAAVATAATSEASETTASEAAPTTSSDSSVGNVGVGAEGGFAETAGAAGDSAPSGAMSVEGDSSLDRVIVSAESQRSVAVAYEESSAALSGTSARTEILRRGVQFVARSGESQAKQERRRLAVSRASSFFSAIANRLDESTAYALGDVPNQLGTTSESAKAQIGASMELQKATISARIEQARGQAMAEAAMARNAVQAQAAAYIADVESQTAAAIESLTATHAETMSQVNALETSTLDSINGIYAAGRTDLEGLGTTIGDECTAKGEEFASTYEGFANCTEDGFWDGNLAERRANAQAKAARSVAEAYHDRMVEAAHKRAREVTRDGRKRDRCSIIASASRSRDTLDEQLPTLINAFEMTRDAAIQQAGVTQNNLIVSIDSSLSATLSQLDQQEQTQRQAVNDTGYMQQVLQEQIAHAAAAAVQRGVQTAVSSVQDAMLDVQARFASSTLPDPVALERALLQVEQNTNAAMNELHTSANAGVAAAAAQLADAVQQAMTSLEGITQSNDELTATLSNGFSSAMNGIAGADNFAIQRITVTEQIQQSVDAGTTALNQILDGFQQSCDTTLEGARTTLTQAHDSLEQNLRQSRQGLECEMARKADEAASQEAPAWKQIIAALLVILVIVIVIAVTVVTAGGALAGLGPLAVIAVGALIGAAVGGAVSGLLAMASNLWNNRDVMEGVGQAVLIGAITGAAGGLIGAAAGVGAGALFSTASTAVQTAAQFGAAMLSAGGVDVVTQYVMNGFSFENFSGTNLAITLVITALTFGLAHRVSTRTGATTTNASETTEPATTTEPTEPVPTADAPQPVPTTDTLETVPTTDTPEAVPTTDTLETVPTTDTPEAVPTTDTPEAVPTTDTLETVPTTDTPEAVPTTDTPEAVPTTDTLETVPLSENDPVRRPVLRKDLQGEINTIREEKTISRRKNIAYADIEITGTSPKRLIGVSGENNPPETVGIPINDEGSPARTFNPKGTGANRRLFDSEVKILEDFSAQYPKGEDVTGTIHLVSERAPCTSCEGVILEFKSRYPNVDLQVFYTVE